MAEKRRARIGHLALDRQLGGDVDLPNPDSHHKHQCAGDRKDRTVMVCQKAMSAA